MLIRALADAKVDECGYIEDEEGRKAAVVWGELASIRWLLSYCLNQIMLFRNIIELTWGPHHDLYALGC